MTTDRTETQDAMGAMLDSMAAQYRDPNLPPGSVMGETEIAGQQVRWTKQRSMVRRGNTPLPERFEAWDIYGRMSMLPTAQMAYMLNKPNAEHDHMRAFHLHIANRGVTRDTCTICPPQTEPYAGSCDWCLKSSGGLTVKRFADQTEQEAHFDIYHPREWATLQRERERQERRDSLAAQQELAKAMLASVERNAAVATSEQETTRRKGKVEGEQKE